MSLHQSHPHLNYALEVYISKHQYIASPLQVVSYLTAPTFKADLDEMGVDPAQAGAQADTWLSAPLNMALFLKEVIEENEPSVLGAEHHTGAEALAALLWVADNLA
ncbi:hypothetical protein [Ralstonia phage phiRSL1]|uniref:Uncharacterized protein n=1 Tax=Ralstonia phage phiRSL1 TaxID=1980924 RepID=B2ZYC6_9CAUD|nr:hypothetical protein RSL1_ORF300 [Ralstonia phage phiRSL1]BAG41746.1 hypothetical protein [Ralstonia phage phiRSL1]